MYLDLSIDIKIYFGFSDDIFLNVLNKSIYYTSLLMTQLNYFQKIRRVLKKEKQEG